MYCRGINKRFRAEAEQAIKFSKYVTLVEVEDGLEVHVNCDGHVRFENEHMFVAFGHISGYFHAKNLPYDAESEYDCYLDDPGYREGLPFAETKAEMDRRWPIEY